MTKTCLNAANSLYLRKQAKGPEASLPDIEYLTCLLSLSERISVSITEILTPDDSFSSPSIYSLIIMGSEISCFSSERVNTCLDSKAGGLFTDDEQTEFQAHAVSWSSLKTGNLDTPDSGKGLGYSVVVSGETSPSPCKTENEVKKKVRIYSSNASKNCFNLIENSHNLNSKCSTRFNSRSNSRCVSPKFHISAMMIE